MKKLSIAVIGQDTDYLEKLSAYLAKRKEFQVYFSGETKEVHNGQNIILTDEPQVASKADAVLKIFLDDRESGAGADHMPVIYKYQAADQIVREMYRFWAEAAREEDVRAFNHKECIGVYAPESMAAQSSFAMVLGCVLAEQNRVLYVNLSQWTGLEELLQETYDRDIGDLLYLIRQQEEQIGAKIQGMVHTVWDLDYIPPAMNSGMLLEAEEKDYEMLLYRMLEQSDYEIILWDIPAGMHGLFPLLEQFSKIYCLRNPGMRSDAQCREFEQYLNRCELQEFAQHLEWMQVPVQVQSECGSCQLEQLLWGKMGEYVREQLQGKTQQEGL